MSEVDAAAMAPLALVFGDAGVSEHLRTMLAGIGARVVYDVEIDALDAAALSDSGAKVVLINLDAVVETRLDEVYSSLDDEGYRVVFNDPASSAGLSGWDQARWARHLGAKLRDDADVDPPRPVDSESVVVDTAAEPAEVSPAAKPMDVSASKDDEWMTDALSVLDAGEPESPNEAITASAEPATSADPVHIDEGTAQQVADDGEHGLELAPLDALPAQDEPKRVDDMSEVIDAGDKPAGDSESRLELLEFALELVDDDSNDSAVNARDEHRVEAEEAPAATDELEPVQIDSSQWSLVDYSLDDISEAPLGEARDTDAATTPGASVVDPLASREFGIELVDPIEYLVPDSPPDRGDELFAAPELMPMHEAVAPQVNDGEQTAAPTTGAARSRLPRLVVLGASIGGPDAVREFLSALPPRFPATFVLAQHLGSEFVDLMINQLGKSSTLPVRLPAHAERAVPGEVLVVPRGRQIFIALDGEVELRELPGTSAHDPSINLTMAMAAENFGADALAIVFSGMANDAVSGALEIAANGGSVWTQDPEHCVVSSMVDAVIAAGVVRFHGTPSALAQHLIDEFGMETPA